MQSKLSELEEAQLSAATSIALELHTKKGKGKSEAIRLAAKKMNVPEQLFNAMRTRIWRLLHPTEKRPRPTTIDVETETLLVDLVAAFSTHANPLSGLEVRCLAQIMGGLEKVPTTGWLKSLRTRYAAKIKLRKGRCSHKKTVLVSLFTGIMEWAEETEQILATIAMLDLFFNIDETRAIPGSKARAVIAATHLTQVQYENALDTTLYTMVGCYAADGTTLFILYIFRARRTKSGLHQDFYSPQLVLEKETRTHHNVSIYVAATGKGYMNSQLWKETMKIFFELVGRRQGLGRLKQAVLTLDGCSSHCKELTIEECAKNNITPIYFKSNSSHVCQPADGPIFQTYKPAVDKEAQQLNFRAALGAPDQKHYALTVSLEAHRKAVTPVVIKESFRKRGIFPFDRQLIAVNAHRACPQDSFVAASEDAQRQLLLHDAINELKETLSSQPTLQRKTVEDVNKPIALEAVPDWKRRKPARKISPTKPPPPKKKQKVEEIEEESEESEGDIDESEGEEDETDFFVPRLVVRFEQKLQRLWPRTRIWYCPSCLF